MYKEIDCRLYGCCDRIIYYLPVLSQPVSVLSAVESAADRTAAPSAILSPVGISYSQRPIMLSVACLKRSEPSQESISALSATRAPSCSLVRYALCSRAVGAS